MNYDWFTIFAISFVIGFGAGALAMWLGFVYQPNTPMKFTRITPTAGANTGRTNTAKVPERVNRD